MTRKLIFISSLMALSLPARADPIAREALGYLVRIQEVVDGDTFVLDSRNWSPFPNLSWKIRIRGIDTPEKRSRCMAERQQAARATVFTKTLIQRAQGRAYLQAIAHDKYGGRFDAVVILPNGKSLGDILIASGLARPYLGGKRLPWCNALGQYRP